jgi:phosphatidylinositol alpha-mannosyltransferase
MISPYSLAVPGGVQAQIMGLARQMRSMGVEVRVLAPCDGPPPDTFVTPLGDSLPTSANGSVAPLAPDPSAVLRTMRALKDEEFDVLHLHEPYAPGPPQTAVLLHPAPIVATFHAAGDSSSYRYLKTAIKAAAQNVSWNVAVSKDAAELAHRYLGGEYEILFNGVELDVYASGPVTPRQGPTIFFCARHEERKGLDVLLTAVADLGSDIRVWVAGSGPDTDRLRRAVQHDSRIEFLGRVTDAEKVARLRGADVFCAPSLHGESFGVVLLEAMAAGTTVVASGLDGYRNVATDGVDSLLVPPGDARALAAALKRALGDDELRTGLEAAGRQRAQEFSMATLAELYIARYMQLRDGWIPPSAAEGSVIRRQARRMLHSVRSPR